jgi:hypothetical protein
MSLGHKEKLKSGWVTCHSFDSRWPLLTREAQGTFGGMVTKVYSTKWITGLVSLLGVKGDKMKSIINGVIAEHHSRQARGSRETWYFILSDKWVTLEG